MANIVMSHYLAPEPSLPSSFGTSGLVTVQAMRKSPEAILTTHNATLLGKRHEAASGKGQKS